MQVNHTHDERVEADVARFGAGAGGFGGREDGGGTEGGGQRGGEDVGFCGGGEALRNASGALGGALLGYGYFFFEREFGEGHAKGGGKVFLGEGEDGFEGAGGVGCED